MNYQMDYFYGHEANQFTFFRIPKLLFSDERFIGLTSDAKILYGLMLDRMGLSVKNGWIDEKNHVLCPPSKNGHRKASKNGMNRSLSFVFERRPHLFHGSLDNEPLPT